MKRTYLTKAALVTGLSLGMTGSVFAFGGVDVTTNMKWNTNEAGRDSNRDAFNRYGSDNVGGDKVTRTGSDDVGGDKRANSDNVGRDKKSYSNSFNRTNSANIKGNAKNVINGQQVNNSNSFGQNEATFKPGMQTGNTQGGAAFGGHASSSVGHDANANKGAVSQALYSASGGHGGSAIGAGISGSQKGNVSQSIGARSKNTTNFSQNIGDVKIYGAK